MSTTLQIKGQKIKSFMDLAAWQAAHELVIAIYEATKSFPRDERFGLITQIQQAAVSITSNIAEGFSRNSMKEKIQFFSTALASLTEVQNQILIGRDVHYLSPEAFSSLYNKAITTNKILSGLIRSTRQNKFSYHSQF